MALETIIYPKGEIGNLGYDYFMQEEHAFHEFLQCANSSINHYQESANNVHAYWGDYYSSPENCIGGHDMKVELSPTAVVTTSTATTTVDVRKKRRRAKSGKNKEELENQRMTHITVERNRRKQMNEYLAVIRGLMPSSYAQRGDQASIVGGVINFVKELEQELQTLEAKKRSNNNSVFSPSPQPFSDFFSFPQYSIRPDASDGSSTSTIKSRLPAMAEIEVTMVESHANIKILSKKRHRSQLLKMVAGLHCLWITILHLNVTTVEQMVLYTLSVKVNFNLLTRDLDYDAYAEHARELDLSPEEIHNRWKPDGGKTSNLSRPKARHLNWSKPCHLQDSNLRQQEESLHRWTSYRWAINPLLEDGCQLSTVDEIADAVNCLLFRIEEESLCSN